MKRESDGAIGGGGAQQIAVYVAHGFPPGGGAGWQPVAHGPGGAHDPSGENRVLPVIRSEDVFHLEMRMAGQHVYVLVGGSLSVPACLISLAAACVALCPLAH